MKLHSLITASLFAFIAPISLNALAASDKPADTNPDATVTAPTASQKKVKPHSHLEEKTGVPQKAQGATTDKPKADKDKTKHYHPRDGK